MNVDGITAVIAGMAESAPNDILVGSRQYSRKYPVKYGCIERNPFGSVPYNGAPSFIAIAIKLPCAERVPLNNPGELGISGFGGKYEQSTLNPFSSGFVVLAVTVGPV